jgi:3-oxoacyl-[acyl-carrier protein] reductase
VAKGKKVALITGGSRGIGLGIARCLAQEDWNLAICGQRPAEAVRDVVHELSGGGSEVLYCQADVSNRADRARLIEMVRERFGRLNALINSRRARRASKRSSELISRDHTFSPRPSPTG